MPKSRISLLRRAGVTAVAAAGLALASQAGAHADQATYTVSPSTDLSDGAVLTGTVTGAQADQTYGFAQCADIGGRAACNPATGSWGTFTTDAGGAGEFTVTVQRAYEGSTPEGEPVGHVDCSVNNCYIGAAHPGHDLGNAYISFN